jgi:hypothetical protein
MKTAIFSAAALVLMGAMFAGIQTALSDDEDDHHERHDSRPGGGRWERLKRRSTGVAPAADPLYQEECGGCHMAYPPGLLPAASWHKIMQGLEDHFGDNAELTDDAVEQLTSFLVANAADRSRYRRSRAFMGGGANADAKVPMRITDLPYFRHEHREIPRWIVKRTEVGSLSHCNACHRYAEQGSFNEHEIYIKGIGRWDD